MARQIPSPFRLAVAVLLLAAAYGTARSQSSALDPGSAGRFYVVAFPDTTANLVDTTVVPPTDNVMAILIYSAVPNRAVISGRSYDNAVTLQPGVFTPVYVKDSVISVENSIVVGVGTVSRNTFTITTAEPIVLYCYTMTRFGAEAWTPVPVDRWGMEYYAAATPGEIVADMSRKATTNYVRANRAAPSEILVIAAYDSTHVTIASNGALENLDRTAVTLNAGEAYQVEGYVDTNADRTGDLQVDLGGSRIVANKPIGVIAGNTRALGVNDRPEVTNNSLKNTLVEWLVPVDQYGHEFVSMPTWDTRHLTGDRGEPVGEKRQAEFVRVYGATDNTHIVHRQDSVHLDTAAVMRSTFHEYRVLVPKAQYFTTDRPAQVMMHSSAVVRYNGTISGAPGSQSYDSWGPYMVEVVPREQWTTFAPFYIPRSIYETQHYVNIVADTNALNKIYDEEGAPFDFNMGVIPGTAMMWGTVPITPGTTHYFEARDGATFYAVGYGLRQGLESYRPAVVGQTFAEYRELIGRSYGYALAPERKILRAPDVLSIDSTRDPCSLTLRLRMTNQNPSGLLSAVFAKGSVNCRVIVAQPAGWNDVAGLASADLRLEPVDPTADAGGTLVITDRMGKTWSVRFGYPGEQLHLDPMQRVDFGELGLGGRKDSTITVTNTTARPVTVNSVQLRSGQQAFSIVSTVPALPSVLAPGGTITIVVRAMPASDRNLYRDTLLVRLACATYRSPLQIGPVPPCIVVNDLNFDTLDVGQPRTLLLNLCNEGHGSVSFSNPAGGKLLTWAGGNFTIPAASVDSLRYVHLGPGECVSLPVTFAAQAEGTYSVISRAWASTRECRDTSLWQALVRRGQAGEVRSEAAGMRAGVQPNPFNGTTRISFAPAFAGLVDVTVFDGSGRPVKTLLRARVAAGEHAIGWDAGDLPSGIYYCRITLNGVVTVLPVILQR
ncbi:MAG TPA: T9SS type A sorting domain-containing protein [Candidatus Kapabacteria bacterium]|nr:T9SS type A sorting domain-containing protein [Candidatus Kapabacteria bacterium]